MIYLYPANKMENLLAIVNKIQQISPLAIFSKEVFIVQNAGIQHWLNMSLAQQRGICLNIDYALPAQYLWKLLRNIVNDSGELDQSPFSREALCWRIFQLLATDDVLNDDVFHSVNRYWQFEHTLKNTCSSYSEQENSKRYQLACQVADLFEQYLIFRPDWIDTWHHHTLFDEQNVGEDFTDTQQWQAKLWQLLVQEQAYNPLKLIEQAIGKLASYQHQLPKRIAFFGINAMAPMWLSFIHALSEHIDIHFFHLNPCFSYWGDILSEKQAIKLVSQWTDGYQEFSESVGNPLLANLGQQGREFLALLQQYSTFNIDAFSSISETEHADKPSVLAQVQEDILNLVDARADAKQLKDESIVITSAHSTLREVQGLHDWLLHQFNADASLTPKDVLVMCPQVEQYAPYVNAVFAQGWQDLDSNIPPLPCSIADRVSKESDPLVAAFAELLTLPDSRFQVNQILSWLRLPAMQQKFGINVEQIEKCTLWLEKACIHWGINQAHKQQVIDGATLSAQFSWQYGFARLLEGFAYSQQADIYQNKLVLPDVEGSDALLLGQLMLVIEQLQYFTVSLKQARTPLQWQQFLLTLVSELFDSQQQEDFQTIYHAIESLVEYCQHADFHEPIDLSVVREFLDHHFSQPDPGRQFMVGQVTFCSMLPMRSIPFKIIAVLGLNDGEFPRQREPLGFDLMAMSPARLGDRSRRGDDRYLFLEAIISARQSLYLSYQGRNIRNNNVKQPSIVLKELMDYLSLGYGWQLDDENNQDIRQLAMQAYSEKNYQGRYPSFDSKWLNISPTSTNKQRNDSCGESEAFVIPIDDVALEQFGEQGINISDITHFFQHPSRYFAQRRLSLYLDNALEQLQDDEPFSCDQLTSYLYKQRLISELLSVSSSNEPEEAVIAKEVQRAQLSGKFPELPHQGQLIEKLTDDSLALYQYLNEQLDLAKKQRYVLSITLDFSSESSPSESTTVKVTTELEVIGEQLVYVRPSSPKVKDCMLQYLNLLLVQVWLEQQAEHLADERYLALKQVISSDGYYFNTKAQALVHYRYQRQDDAYQQLQQLVKVFIRGQSQPLLLNNELAEKIHKAKVFEQSHFEAFWHDDYNRLAFGQDPYIGYFWQQCPQLSDIIELINHVYHGVFAAREQMN